ncbi:cytochrome P450 [Artemisia annua]|uniref:Cytochrome P450 n=1 Tax=Artemisia annua TaxID=35608 RepID=A0A2U1LTY7_ARTAN|nr:cytochrome P450 [Artemisia annua]
MREVFAKYGKVVDVYIEKKRNKLGKRFGFVRFATDSNLAGFEKLLNTISIGTQKLWCNIAHFQRPTTANNGRDRPPARHSTRPAQGADNTHNLILDEGFDDFSIKYLGGLHILIQFPNSDLASKALLNPTFSSHFLSLQPWNANFRTSKRLTWIAISGLPPLIWSTKVFSDIAEHWGNVVIPEECNMRQFNRKEVNETNKSISDSEESHVRSTHVSKNHNVPIGHTLAHISPPKQFGPSNSGSPSQYISKAKTHSSSSKRSHSVPATTFPNRNQNPIRRRRFTSLRLFDPFKGVRGYATQPKKPIRKSTSKPNTSAPIHSTSASCDNIEISDSLSNIQRCNMRILNNDSYSESNYSESNEVSNTIQVGNQIGFKMNGKERDIESILANGEHNKVTFLGLQETMTGTFDRFTVQSLWNNTPFEFVYNESNGTSGGILAVWDTTHFSLTDSLKGDGYLALHGRLRNIDPSFLILLYYPWDFNEVRNETERLGTIFDKRSASFFNDFIHSTGICDLPMGGKRFTRMNNIGSKHSKIDRFLVSNHFVHLWPNTNVLALPREFSDHTPILLKTFAPDFGPTPFKLFNTWLEHHEFPDLVRSSWTLPVTGRPTVGSLSNNGHSLIGFKLKLQRLKNSIKQWRSSLQDRDTVACVELRNIIDSLDTKAESTCLSPIEVESRNSSIKLLANLEQHKKQALWCQVIRSIYGSSGALNVDSTIRSNSGVWYQIVKLRSDLLKVNINLPSIFKIKLGNGQSTSFWHDPWIGGSPLKDSFPRLYRLDTNPNCNVFDRKPSVLTSPAVIVPVSSN